MMATATHKVQFYVFFTGASLLCFSLSFRTLSFYFARFLFFFFFFAFYFYFRFCRPFVTDVFSIQFHTLFTSFTCGFSVFFLVAFSLNVAIVSVLFYFVLFCNHIDLSRNGGMCVYFVFCFIRKLKPLNWASVICLLRYCVQEWWPLWWLWWRWLCVRDSTQICCVILFNPFIRFLSVFASTPNSSGCFVLCLILTLWPPSNWTIIIIIQTDIIFCFLFTLLFTDKLNVFFFFSFSRLLSISVITLLIGFSVAPNFTCIEKKKSWRKVKKKKQHVTLKYSNQ